MKQNSQFVRIKNIFLGSVFLSLFQQVAFGATLTLPELLQSLKEHNPSIMQAKAGISQANAELTTTMMYPNPEIEVGGGTSTGLGQGALSGTNEQLYFSQSLDLPFVRDIRAQVAQMGIESAQQTSNVIWLNACATTKQAFYLILRRQMQLQIAQDNQQLLTQIRDKVKLKVEIGEAARYEEVKAQAELLNAMKMTASAQTQVQDAKSALRALFSDVIASDFDVSGDLPKLSQTLPNLAQLRETVLERQPVLKQTLANTQKAKAQIHLEEMQRFPIPTLKAGLERDPGLEQWKIGVSIPLPLWNQRQGQIAQAQAAFAQQEAQMEQQRLAIIRELENAYNRYIIADQQVTTFETGLLNQAQKTLKVAEAAYKLGERGILDYLDAQRVFRGVRNDYLNAIFDRQDAWIDLQKLNADDLLEQE